MQDSEILAKNKESTDRFGIEVLLRAWLISWFHFSFVDQTRLHATSGHHPVASPDRPV